LRVGSGDDLRADDTDDPETAKPQRRHPWSMQERQAKSLTCV
jgi:hypothetical protein